ncbi:hypothetical protein Cgig2_015693 [Carnegiea gigantea]|uniref:Uncharacterized protein n=1 Tax=Carnegiea gigantea TaxID=171969 RepID=A0A9Q1GTK5_9CARY|nr:hypothetical protein Cgig2_015693 [Carnegiea gigantea]
MAPNVTMTSMAEHPNRGALVLHPKAYTSVLFAVTSPMASTPVIMPKPAITQAAHPPSSSHTTATLPTTPHAYPFYFNNFPLSIIPILRCLSMIQMASCFALYHSLLVLYLATPNLRWDPLADLLCLPHVLDHSMTHPDLATSQTSLAPHTSASTNNN